VAFDASGRGDENELLGERIGQVLDETGDGEVGGGGSNKISTYL
jgi:hypothetical protein